ncbi:MAG: response regulator [Planctomycetes bacterium]|nr:response regulator [Planctomycetota bacterium]
MSATRGPRRILVVEDDSKLADILEHKLRQEGCQVRRASTGFEAGLLVRSFRPHLVLLDLMLPGVDGAEVCRQIRTDPELSRVRVLGMSAASDDALLDRFRRLADDFMPKPFKLAEILPRIEKLLGPAIPDPELFERNRVVLLSKDAAWTDAASRALGSAGYAVEACATPEAAGFAVARTGAAAIAANGVEARVLETLRRTFRVVEAPPERLPDAVAAAAGRIIPRRRSRGFLPSLIASLGILAAAAALLLWPRSTAPPAPEPDPEVEQWRTLERRAADGRLVYFMGSYVARESLGEGTLLRLADRTVEGFVVERGEGLVVRTAAGMVTLKKADVIERWRARLPYEEYWERSAATEARDAGALHALGLWCRARGLPEAAAREFRRALVADANHAPSRRELGYALRGGRWVR